ncbi:hypothetical protein BDZ89DRAFT_1063504 [Hymenopellis radicata]|nr:hypothetical protein BDZ89DRAFT_1063504 [Hymenopellis radicata]
MADTKTSEATSAFTPTPAQVQAIFLKLTAVFQDPAKRVAPAQSALGTPWLLELHQLLLQIPPEAPEYQQAQALLGPVHWSEAFSLRLTSALAHDAVALPAASPPIKVVVNQNIKRDRTART